MNYSGTNAELKLTLGASVIWIDWCPGRSLRVRGEPPLPASTAHRFKRAFPDLKRLDSDFHTLDTILAKKAMARKGIIHEVYEPRSKRGSIRTWFLNARLTSVIPASFELIQ
jgi:hypothetical protein